MKQLNSDYSVNLHKNIKKAHIAHNVSLFLSLIDTSTKSNCN